MSSTDSSSRFVAAATRILRSRRLVRAPIWLYRARLGALLGPRLLMLEHVGRKSGLPRHVVLEVVVRPAPESFVVASGFGERAQWFRNIEANPRVRVYLGSHAPAPATARVFDQPDADRAMAAYIDRHPRAWQKFKPVLEQTLGGPSGDTDTPLPLVELRLDGAVRQ